MTMLFAILGLANTSISFANLESIAENLVFFSTLVKYVSVVIKKYGCGCKVLLKLNSHFTLAWVPLQRLEF